MIEEVLWSQVAHIDRSRLREWLEQISPVKAQNVAELILSAIEKLKIHPRLGRRLSIFQNGEVRELFISPYVMRYAIMERKIYILRIWHYREDRSTE